MLYLVAFVIISSYNAIFSSSERTRHQVCYRDIFLFNQIVKFDYKSRFRTPPAFLIMDIVATKVRRSWPQKFTPSKSTFFLKYFDGGCNDSLHLSKGFNDGTILDFHISIYHDKNFTPIAKFVITLYDQTAKNTEKLSDAAGLFELYVQFVDMENIVIPRLVAPRNFDFGRFIQDQMDPSPCLQLLHDGNMILLKYEQLIGDRVERRYITSALIRLTYDTLSGETSNITIPCWPCTCPSQDSTPNIDIFVPMTPMRANAIQFTFKDLFNMDLVTHMDNGGDNNAVRPLSTARLSNIEGVFYVYPNCFREVENKLFLVRTEQLKYVCILTGYFGHVLEKVYQNEVIGRIGYSMKMRDGMLRRYVFNDDEINTCKQSQTTNLPNRIILNYN